MYDPINEHLKDALRIIRYLKSARDYTSRKLKIRLQVYIDADWAGSRLDMISTTRYETYVWDNLVT